MASPYRESEGPLVEYPVRTAKTPLFVFAGVAVAMLAVLGLCLYAQVGLRTMWITLIGCVMTLLLLAAETSQYRIGGTQGTLRLHRTHLELPRAWNASPWNVTWSTLHIGVQRTRTRVYLLGVLPVERPQLVVTFTAPGIRRRLSHSVFGSLQTAEEAVVDLFRVAQGGTPIDRNSPATLQPPSLRVDEYDARIDEELQRMD